MSLAPHTTDIIGTYYIVIKIALEIKISSEQCGNRDEQRRWCIIVIEHTV